MRYLMETCNTLASFAAADLAPMQPHMTRFCDFAVAPLTQLLMEDHQDPVQIVRFTMEGGAHHLRNPSFTHCCVHRHSDGHDATFMIDRPGGHGRGR